MKVKLSNFQNICVEILHYIKNLLLREWTVLHYINVHIFPNFLQVVFPLNNFEIL